MVFFNYSTMQVAAKIVYYGPGLCGKTTNLQFIYDRTTSDSRGEMVSLQTETDRTLFFDLLPIDLGSIGGFKTKIQLYTVPGQVFYNTTRKLVLKGVDAIVFVADSQRLMMDANRDSMKNLEVNLTEIGLGLGDIPVVLQLNKRDLPDVATVEELNAALNPHQWPYFEASALSGQGVFETLTGVAKLTLASLKDRLGAGSSSRRSKASEPVPPAPAETPPPKTVEPSEPQTAKARGDQPSETPAVASGIEAAISSPPAPEVAADAALETEAGGVATSVAPPPKPLNGQVKMDRNAQLHLPIDALRRAKRVSISLRLEDEDQNAVADLERGYDIESHSELNELLLRLSVSVRSS